jgi:hypothetical protein
VGGKKSSHLPGIDQLRDTICSRVIGRTIRLAPGATSLQVFTPGFSTTGKPESLFTLKSIVGVGDSVGDLIFGKKKRPSNGP